MDKSNHLKIIFDMLISREVLCLSEERRELASLPDGTLITRTRKNGNQYYSLKLNEKEKGITKDPALICALSRKQQLETSIHNRKSNIELLKATSKALSSNNIDNVLSPDPEQSQNSYATENLIYKCSNGLLVRSKSERIIANKLLEYNIVFKYEFPIEINSYIYYPDFTIYRVDGKKILWEHNGLMDKEDYYYKALQKIQKYKSIGFVQHKNLICTEENDIRDEDTLDDIIMRFILL